LRFARALIHISAMSRGTHSFKQSDLAKAVKAVAKSGVKGWRIELVDGRIVICGGEDRESPDVRSGESEWD
jgi:hypothetical protein